MSNLNRGAGDPGIDIVESWFTMTRTATTQRIGLATTINALVAQLDAGGEMTACFLFGEPRRNWVGMNNTVQIVRQVAVGNHVVIEGTLQRDHDIQYVTLVIDITTGDGHATFGAVLTDEDLRVLEVSYGAVNSIASTPTLI